MGAILIDADAISRETTQSGGSAIQLIADQFGAEFVAQDGAMDRHRMRQLVFSDPDAKRRLESIIHPLIHEEVARRADAAGASPVVFDLPLLVESLHWRVQLDKVLVIDCSVETQISRVAIRNGWPREQIEEVVRQQSTRQQRLAAADWVLHNEGIDLHALSGCVRQVAQRIGL